MAHDEIWGFATRTPHRSAADGGVRPEAIVREALLHRKLQESAAGQVPERASPPHAGRRPGDARLQDLGSGRPHGSPKRWPPSEFAELLDDQQDGQHDHDPTNLTGSEVVETPRDLVGCEGSGRVRGV